MVTEPYPVGIGCMRVECQNPRRCGSHHYTALSERQATHTWRGRNIVAPGKQKFHPPGGVGHRLCHSLAESRQPHIPTGIRGKSIDVSTIERTGSVAFNVTFHDISSALRRRKHNELFLFGTKPYTPSVVGNNSVYPAPERQRRVGYDTPVGRKIAYKHAITVVESNTCVARGCPEYAVRSRIDNMNIASLTIEGIAFYKPECSRSFSDTIDATVRRGFPYIAIGIYKTQPVIAPVFAE